MWKYWLVRNNNLKIHYSKLFTFFCDIFCRNSRKILFNKLYQVVLRFSWKLLFYMTQLSGAWNKQMHSVVSSFKTESGPASPNKKNTNK